MELNITKTNTPGCEFGYIKSFTFGGHIVTPNKSEWGRNALRQEVHVDGQPFEYISAEPVCTVFGNHLTEVHLYGPNGEDIHVEGEEIYKYIDRKIKIFDDHGHSYEYMDSEPGPIVADMTDRQFGGEVLPEFLGQIVDIFEDYLDDHEMTIMSEERQAELSDAVEEGTYATLEDAVEDMGLAAIYGSDYDLIADVYRQMSDNWDSELPKDAVSRDQARSYSDAITAQFMEIMKDRGTYLDGDKVSIDKIDTESLTEKVLETFTNWGLCGIDTKGWEREPEL